MINKLHGFRLPDDFLIGTANSAFQSEGAWDRDGKSESIMDHYAKLAAGQPIEFFTVGVLTENNLKTTKRGDQLKYTEDLPDRGCLFYDNYEKYIDDMKKTGQNVYRMSLAWPRIIPTGVGEVNQKAIDHYNKVIDKLLECGITPFVDIYHWDLPQCLQDKGGFANPEFPEWYEAYAKVCFENFGDRVKMWSTFNESDISIRNGYATKRFPPFEADIKNSIQASLYTIVAHFRAVRLYKSMNLGGVIGSVNCISALTPAECNEEDIGAVTRQYQRSYDWWLQPMLEGTFPQQVIRECPYIKDNMPENYQEILDKEFIPMDFIGINYYVSTRTGYDPDASLKSRSASSFYSAPGQQFTPYPPGLYDVIQYTAERYNNVPMYITENGCALVNKFDKEAEIDDPERIAYLREHLRMCARLVRAGYNLKGYMYWNDADSYEELDGYHLRFGLTWVDPNTGETEWKKSRYYFSEVCKSHLVN